jgi:ShK domain-like
MPDDNLVISRQGWTRSVVSRVTKTTSRPPPPQRRRRLSSSSYVSIVAPFIFATLVMMILLANLAFVSAQECSSANPEVCDQHERCGVWRAEGECQLNKRYMREVCPASCESELVTGGASSTKFKTAAAVQMNKKKKTVKKKEDASLPCEDQHERCHIWARVGECSENKSTMRKYCPKSCGFCAGDGGDGAAVLVEDDSEDEDEDDDDDESVHFDSDDDDEDDDLDLLEGDPPGGDPDCEDKDDLCTYWASVGECQANRYERTLTEGR